MKLKSKMAIIGLTLFALIASAPSFARTKAEIDASAARAITHFYALNPQHKELAGLFMTPESLDKFQKSED